MLASAPSHLRCFLAVDTDKSSLIEDILFLRHEEAVEEHLRSKTGQKCLEDLLGLSTARLMFMASFNPSQLRATMQKVLLADPAIEPREIPTSSEGLVITTLLWQIHSQNSS